MLSPTIGSGGISVSGRLSVRPSVRRQDESGETGPYVVPKSPKRGLKNAKRPIFIKNALRLKKVCYKVSLCENYQRQSCKAFIGLTIGAKIIGGGATPCTRNF